MHSAKIRSATAGPLAAVTVAGGSRVSSSAPSRSARPRRDGGVLTRLRETTAEAHRRVEERLFPSALHDRGSYAAMLQVLLALHEPLETWFPSVGGFAAVGIDLGSRRKAPRLRADLAELDVEPPAAVSSIPSGLYDLPGALGAVYVLEGSTLGGRVLLEQATDRLGTVPTRFLSGYGDDTGRYWRRTRTALVEATRRAADPAEAEKRLVGGAVATFAHLDGLLTSAGWPST